MRSVEVIKAILKQEQMQWYDEIAEELSGSFDQAVSASSIELWVKHEWQKYEFLIGAWKLSGTTSPEGVPNLDPDPTTRQNLIEENRHLGTSYELYTLLTKPYTCCKVMSYYDDHFAEMESECGDDGWEERFHLRGNV